MPDSNPKYKKIPRPDSIKFFEENVRGHKAVIDVNKVSNQVYKVIRRNKTLLVFLTNIYIVSEADVYEILAENNNINAIITMSAWNSYTSDANKHCLSQQIGLFTFREFMGALNFDNDKFLNYKPS